MISRPATAPPAGASPRRWSPRPTTTPKRTEPGALPPWKVRAPGPTDAMLAGFDPEIVGLVLVHPQSCAAQPDLARRGRVFAAVEPLDDLLGLARRLNLEPRRRPGWFSVLLVGIEASGLIFLAPTSRLDFERRAS